MAKILCYPASASAPDAAVLAPWSSIGSGDSATRADYSTGRAAYGFSAKRDLPAQLPALNQQVAENFKKLIGCCQSGESEDYSASIAGESCHDLTTSARNAARSVAGIESGFHGATSPGSPPAVPPAAAKWPASL